MQWLGQQERVGDGGRCGRGARQRRRLRLNSSPGLTTSPLSLRWSGGTVDPGAPLSQTLEILGVMPLMVVKENTRLVLQIMEFLYQYWRGKVNLKAMLVNARVTGVDFLKKGVFLLFLLHQHCSMLMNNFMPIIFVHSNSLRNLEGRRVSVLEDHCCCLQHETLLNCCGCSREVNGKCGATEGPHATDSGVAVGN